MAKVCPLLSINWMQNAQNTLCLGVACAWWNDEMGGCIVQGLEWIGCLIDNLIDIKEILEKQGGR